MLMLKEVVGSASGGVCFVFGERFSFFMIFFCGFFCWHCGVSFSMSGFFLARLVCFFLFGDFLSYFACICGHFPSLFWFLLYEGQYTC
jgi:hypothetical protein